MFNYNTQRNNNISSRFPVKLGESVFLKRKNGEKFVVTKIGDTENQKLSAFYQKIKKEYDESMEEYRAGKLKGYNSTKEMWEDLEREGYI